MLRSDESDWIAIVLIPLTRMPKFSAQVEVKRDYSLLPPPSEDDLVGRWESYEVFAHEFMLSGQQFSHGEIICPENGKK